MIVRSCEILTWEFLIFELIRKESEKVSLHQRDKTRTDFHLLNEQNNLKAITHQKFQLSKEALRWWASVWETLNIWGKIKYFCFIGLRTRYNVKQNACTFGDTTQHDSQYCFLADSKNMQIARDRWFFYSFLIKNRFILKSANTALIEQFWFRTNFRPSIVRIRRNIE